MAVLHILQLQCLNREDVNSPDEATLQINGNMVSGPHLMVAGDVIPSRSFTPSPALWMYTAARQTRRNYEARGGA